MMISYNAFRFKQFKTFRLKLLKLLKTFVFSGVLDRLRPSKHASNFLSKTLFDK
jgi:hypothetical protein